MAVFHIALPGGLQAAQAKSKAAIDAAAGEARRRHITIAPGQSETYTAKAAQAEAYLAAGSPPDMTGWAWVQADADAFGMSPETAANSILANRDAWVQIGAHVEAVRLRAKADVDAATSPMDCARITRAVCETLDQV